VSFLLAAFALSVQARSSVTLAWDPSPGSAVAGYRVYQGVESRNYTSVISAGTVTTSTVAKLTGGTTYFFAVTAYDTNGLESQFSSEVIYTVPRSPSIVPAIGSALTFAADSGTLNAPLVSSNGTTFQSVETSVANGGRATYSFNILDAGNYIVSALVSAPNEGQNSFGVNIDAEPADPLMIWDIPVSSELTRRSVSWRGNGNGDPASSQYSPKVFTLSAGAHQLIIRGREANARLGTISIAAAPPTLQIHAAPGGSVALSGTGQAGQTYNVLCSQDLKVWTVIGTATTDVNGLFAFSDPAAQSRPRGFYRLQSIAVPVPGLQIHAAAGGPITLSGTGQPGQAYKVLCSEDLKIWTVIGVVTLDAGGSFQFTDPAATSRPRGFYRLQSIARTAPMLQIHASAAGSVALSGVGQPGQTYNVLCSQDLAAWTSIGTMTLDATGSGQFTDPAGNIRPRCFYRLLGP
jgi:hypothetical protein